MEEYASLKYTRFRVAANKRNRQFERGNFAQIEIEFIKPNIWAA